MIYDTRNTSATTTHHSVYSLGSVYIARNWPAGLETIGEGFYLIYRHGLYKDPNNPVNTRYVQYFCRRLCDVFNIEVQVHGVIPREPALWVSNHISWLDVAVLGSGARIFFWRAEIEKWPILGNLARVASSIPFHSQIAWFAMSARMLIELDMVAPFIGGKLLRSMCSAFWKCQCSPHLLTCPQFL